MRLAFAASALCLSLSVFTLASADSQTPPPPPTTAAPLVADAAAAKHAKRTACLKEAKAKKLVGADKSAFLKDCIDAP